MYRADEMLAETMHRNSTFRSAGYANAVDLLNNMGKLDDEKRFPRYFNTW